MSNHRYLYFAGTLSRQSSVAITDESIHAGSGIITTRGNDRRFWFLNYFSGNKQVSSTVAKLVVDDFGNLIPVNFH